MFFLIPDTIIQRTKEIDAQTMVESTKAKKHAKPKIYCKVSVTSTFSIFNFYFSM